MEAQRLSELCAGLPMRLRIAGAALPDHQDATQLAADIEMFGPRDPVDRILALRTTIWQSPTAGCCAVSRSPDGPASARQRRRRCWPPTSARRAPARRTRPPQD